MNQKLILPDLLACLLTLCLAACGGGDNNDSENGNDVWDVDNTPLPEFVTENYIDLNKISRISLFRSSIGHDYSDFTEDCRSMKHYFEPRADVDWGTTAIYAPVSGTVTRVEAEFAGTKIEIAADEYPAFRFSIFHVNLSKPLQINDKITAGEQLGTHIGQQTYSDISVIVNDTTHQGRMVSFFQVINDDVFSRYKARGLAAREDIIISKAIRDDNPMTCAGDTFTSTDTLESWFDLN